MFGLSLSAIVTIVKPIIGILNDAASLFQKGREIWKDLRQANRSDDVQSLVSTSGNQVQQEYDVGLRYMGGAFAEGDDIVRKALNQHQNTFKYEVFPLLTLDPSYDAAAVVLRVATHTAAARDRSIAALHDFGQRLMQKAPIKRGPAPPRPATLRAERYGQRATGHQPSGYAFHSSTPVAPTRGNATAAPRYDEPSVGNVSSNVDVRDRQEEAQPGTRNPGLSEGTLSRRVPTLEQRNAGYNCFQQLTWRAASSIEDICIACPACPFELDLSESLRHHLPGPQLRTKDDRIVEFRCCLAKFHINTLVIAKNGIIRGVMGLRCFLCKDEKIYRLRSDLKPSQYHLYSDPSDPDGFGEHIESCHTWTELCTGSCSYPSCGETW